MIQGFVRASLRRAVFFAAGLVIAAVPLSGAGRASDASCPQARQELTGATVLRAVTQHLRQREPIRILAIGSSSTQGVGASSPSFSYPSQLERFLDAAWKTEAVEVENAGIGGETVTETVRRLESELREPETPDLVIWQLGTNDAVRGLDIDHFRALVERGIAAARAANVDLILLDQQYYPGIKDLVRYEAFVGAVREIGAHNRIPVFSRYALMKSWADLLSGDVRSMLARDGFHMSDRGYTCLTQALGSAVASVVRPASVLSATAAATAPADLGP